MFAGISKARRKKRSPISSVGEGSTILRHSVSPFFLNDHSPFRSITCLVSVSEVWSGSCACRGKLKIITTKQKKTKTNHGLKDIIKRDFKVTYFVHV